MKRISKELERFASITDMNIRLSFIGQCGAFFATVFPVADRFSMPSPIPVVVSTARRGIALNSSVVVPPIPKQQEERIAWSKHFHRISRYLPKNFYWELRVVHVCRMDLLLKTVRLYMMKGPTAPTNSCPAPTISFQVG